MQLPETQKMSMIRQDGFGKDKSDQEVFYDLCFCICAPQTKFVYNREVIKALIEADFYGSDISVQELEKIVLRVRFFRNKAKYLLRAKSIFSIILNVVRSEEMSDMDKREWLTQVVEGVGMKVASHFLRNIGCKDLAIIDVHVLKYLNCLPPKNKAAYLELESMFRDAAANSGTSVAELDLIVWRHYSGIEADERDGDLAS